MLRWRRMGRGRGRMLVVRWGGRFIASSCCFHRLDSVSIAIFFSLFSFFSFDLLFVFSPFPVSLVSIP